MAGLSALLNSPQGRQLIGGMAREMGQSEDKTADILSMALPLLLGAMKKNVSSQKGAEGLLVALSGKHTGGILDNLEVLFGGGVDKEVIDDGAGILRHVFGNRQTTIENAISQKSGLDADTVAQILKIAAPVIMGYLGRQKAQSRIKDGGDLNTLLGSMLGGQPRENQSLIMSLIDTDGDGSVLDDVADMVLGAKKKKVGPGGLLGGLFRN